MGSWGEEPAGGFLKADVPSVMCYKYLWSGELSELCENNIKILSQSNFMAKPLPPTAAAPNRWSRLISNSQRNAHNPTPTDISQWIPLDCCSSSFTRQHHCTHCVETALSGASLFAMSSPVGFQLESAVEDCSLDVFARCVWLSRVRMAASCKRRRKKKRKEVDYNRNEPEMSICGLELCSKP